MQPIWLDSYAPGVPAEIEVAPGENLVALINAACANYPDNTAFTNFGDSLTFAEVDVLSRQVADFLLTRLELEPGSRVAIMMPNCLQYPVIMFGVLRAGMVVVNVNPLYRPHEAEHQLRDAGAEAIFVIDQAAAQLQEVAVQTNLRCIVVTRLGDLLGFAKGTFINFAVKRVRKLVAPFEFEDALTLKQVLAGTNPEFDALVQPDADDLAFLQYTGGTTGRAKGAMLSHGNLVANVKQLQAWFKDVSVDSSDIMVTALPLYHVFALTANCLLYFSCGGENLLITNPRDTDGFVKILASARMTAITGVNTLYQALLNHPKFPGIDFTTLRLAIAGGMALQEDTAARWQRTTGVPITEGYGLSETSPVLTVNPTGLDAHTLTAGLPLPSTDISIRGDDENELPTGQPGELCARGPQVMSGYWNDREATAAAFTRDGCFKTGDIAVMDERGFVRIVDRKKDMIIVSGFNVYPNEIENVTVLHPRIAEAACIGVPDGESGEAAVLYVVPVPGAEVGRDEITAYLREELAPYKVPRSIEFVTELPKSNVGKVLRRELRDRALKGQEPAGQGV